MRWNSDKHPISDIIDWDSQGRLELQPDFQRHEVWSRSAQIMLIDTILKNIPIPKIYIKSYIKDLHTYRVVIDGQQRLTAILAFVKNEFPLSAPYCGEYQEKYFDDLPEKIQSDILGYSLDMNEILNPSDEEVRDLYARVNKYTVQLNKQELRKADYSGDFIKLAEELSVIPFFDDIKIFTAHHRRRMLDVEYIEELLSIQLEGIQEKKEQLDAFCEKYRILGDQIDDIRDKFISIIEDISLIFNEDQFPMYKTRFKQKSDFYSVFACINELQNESKHIIKEKIPDLQKDLMALDENIEPQAEEDKYKEYAMRCLSDANSHGSRIWRKDFLKEYFEKVYE